MTEQPKITPTEDGPLVVSAAPDLIGSDGAVIASKDTATLCRCGHSGNKPFCDGSHKAAGFSSAVDRSKIRNTPIAYKGTVNGIEVTVGYTPVLCTHAAACQRLAAAVFDPEKRPWVQPENGALPDIMDAVAACPSGALRLTLGEMPPQQLTTGEVSLRVEKNGPYHVRNIVLAAEFNGAQASRAKYSLCRCGMSKNKPFCDGSHHDANWSDD